MSSINYHKTLSTNGNIELKVNFVGIENGKTTPARLKLSIYAYNLTTGDPVFTDSLDFDEITDLYHYLSQISIVSDSSKTTTGEFIETSTSYVDLIKKMETLGIDAITAILDKFSTDDKVKGVLESLTQDELDHISVVVKHEKCKKELEKLVELLKLEDEGDIVKTIKSRDDLSDYHAAQPEKIFQKWIEQNLWVFGVEYFRKHDESKIALFSDADLLMESLDGFLDLIELKRPKAKTDLFTYDNSHKCYHPSSSLSQVIGQSLFYLEKMADMKLNLQQEYKVKVLQPRVKIILGRSTKFDDQQYQALRMLNSNLNHIQIFTYDYILDSGYKLLEHYES